MTDSNRQPTQFRDLHLYAAYSTRLVGDTGSHPHVSMPSHRAAPTAPIPDAAIHAVAGPRRHAAAQRRALKPIAIGGAQTRARDRYRELCEPFCNIAGGVVSPVLSNIYLHYVLDLWFERRFKKTCQARGSRDLPTTL